MSEKREKSTYLCFGNIEPCKTTLRLRMKYKFVDGTIEEYSGLEMTCGEKRAKNVKYYEKADKLLISANADMIDTDNRALEEIEILFANPVGAVERLCLKYGFSAINELTGRYEDSWETDVFRYDRAVIRFENNFFTVDFLMNKSENDVATESVSAAIEEKSEADLMGNIEADLKILSYYSNDNSTSAKNLLEQAREKVCAGDNSSAHNFINQAEELLAECINQSLHSVRLYRDNME